MLLNDLGDELATTTSPRGGGGGEIMVPHREVKFRDELIENYARPKTGKSKEKEKDPIEDVQKSLKIWYDKDGHEVIYIVIEYSISKLKTLD